MRLRPCYRPPQSTDASPPAVELTLSQVQTAQTKQGRKEREPAPPGPETRPNPKKPKPKAKHQNTQQRRNRKCLVPDERATPTAAGQAATWPWRTLCTLTAPRVRLLDIQWSKIVQATEYRAPWCTVRIYGVRNASGGRGDSLTAGFAYVVQ